MILIVDNYDSFTNNLAQYVGSFNYDIVIKKNNHINIEDVHSLSPSHIILSPGPGKPEEAGICIELIKNFYNKIPILGVCLGHQAIGITFGCHVVKNNDVCHGKTSKVFHDGESDLYKNIPLSFVATRYHSLIINSKSKINSDLIVDAKLEDGTVMGIRHNKYPVFGVQYHPESIKTEHGIKLIENFLYVV